MALRIGPQPRAPLALLRPLVRPDGGIRWLTELTPEASAAYLRAVRTVSRTTEPRLSRRVVANRLAGPGLVLEPWRRAHVRWRRGVAEGIRDRGVRAVLKMDVRACYASITPEVVAAQLIRLGVATPETAAVVCALGRFQDDGVRGLPVGPDPSAVLANLVLHGVDEALTAAGVRHLRWVDDIVIFARCHRETVTSRDAALRSLERLGLRLNDRKSALLLDRADAHAVVGGADISPVHAWCVR